MSRKPKSEKVIQLEIARENRLKRIDEIKQLEHNLWLEVEHINDTIKYENGEEYAFEREMPSDSINFDRWDPIH